jgi:hypothetical protein
MLKRKLEAEARFDIAIAEKDLVEKHLSEIKDKEDVIDQTEMLKYGPIGSGSFHGLGTDYYNPKRAKAQIDGQYLSMVGDTGGDDGFIIIDDQRSPFNGMKTSDYYKLVREWKLVRAQIEAKRFKKLKDECIAEHIEVPTHAAFRSVSIVDKKDLPAWPEWAIKYDKNGKPVDDSTMTRTRHS